MAAGDKQARAAIETLRARIARADEASLDLMFREARSFKGWLDRPVEPALLYELFALVNAGPTSGNACPARYVFVTSNAARADLLPAIDDANRAKVAAAPVTVVIGYDREFFRAFDVLAPHRTDGGGRFASDAALAEETAFRNGTLQGGYLILAARALGLDVGPVQGFDNDAVDALYFAGTAVRSNFLCNLGYGDPADLPPKPPRLSFDAACRIL
jgi:3-hydroxypropanoate dehydrogenase